MLGITEHLVAAASLSDQKEAETYEVSKKVKSLTKQMRREIAIFMGTKAAYTLLFRRLKPSRLYILSAVTHGPPLLLLLRNSQLKSASFNMAS